MAITSATMAITSANQTSNMEQQHQLPLQQHNLQLSGNNNQLPWQQHQPIHTGKNSGLTSTTDNNLAITSADVVNTKSQLKVCVLLPSHILMAKTSA